MDCADPFVKKGEVYPCGKCLPCKFRARRIWFSRVLLEASQHDYSTAFTLTYDEAALPEDGMLHPEHLRNWLKRHRKRALERYPWRRLRFISAGEYGETTQRPHYHVVLFGQPACEKGRTQKQWCGDCSCVTCADVSETWPCGAVSCAPLDRASAAYISGYVTRKVLSLSPPKMVKPFMRMSTMPGIGAAAMWDVASTIIQYQSRIPVLPTALQQGSNALVLGRYLRRKLNEYLGRDGAPDQVANEAVQAVCDYAWKNSRSIREVFRQINEHSTSQLSQREALKQKGAL